MERYEGVLNIDKMGEIEKKAYKSWKDQGQRCDNPNDKGYKYWGQKGIRRIYGPREFIAWYLVEYSKRTEWKRCHVDRISSDGNYEFGNIQLLEMSENTKKRNDLYGNPSASEKIQIAYPCGKIIVFESIREASRETGLLRRTIQQRVRNILKRKPKDDLIITAIR
jgi:hypothetical protein